MPNAVEVLHLLLLFRGAVPAAAWMTALTILTLGHSTRPIDEFLALLAGHRVQRLVDVRTVPRSGHNPQFNSDSLARALAGVGIGYLHLPGLGGLRRPRPDSPNGAWRNTSFRGYADHMQSAAFAESLQRCIDLAARESLALMCAEAVPWRCHRSLIADALIVRGIEAREITGLTSSRAHVLTPWAKVEGTTITYPAVF